MKKTVYFKKLTVCLAILMGSLSISVNLYGQSIYHAYGSFCVGSTNVFSFSGPGSVTSWYIGGNYTIISSSGTYIQLQWNSPVSNTSITAYYSGGSATY